MKETSPASPSAPPLWQRLLLSLATITLMLALVVIALLVVAGTLPAVYAALEQMLAEDGEVPRAAKIAVGVTGLVIMFLPVVFMVVAGRRKWFTARFLLVAWCVVAPVLAWLSWDDPALLHPVSIEEFSPAFPGAEESYRVLMQYSKQTPSAEAKAFEQFKPQVQLGGANTREPEKWREFVVRERAKLEADWTALDPQRRWLEELNAFERWGDLTPSDYNANIITFQVWRILAQRACAYATILALDGRRDEAVILIAPVIEAGRKLQTSSRTLVRTMIGVVIERMSLETAGIILDLGPVAAPARDRLAVAIGPDNAAAMARRLLLIEYVQFAPVFFRMKLGDQVGAVRGIGPLVRGPLNFLGGLFLNPNATINLYGSRAFALAELAERRELGRFAVQRQGLDDVLFKQPGIKNLAGRLMLNMSVPAYDKVLESHWKTADVREALRRRLAEASGPADVK